MENIIALIKTIFAKIKEIIEKILGKDEPDVVTPPEDVVCYYGCPNSKRVEKLQLNKKNYK